MSRLYSDDRLENPEIRRRVLSYPYPDGYKPSETLVDNIIQSFWFRNAYGSFLAYPHIVDEMIVYLSAKKPTSFHRIAFYRFWHNRLVTSTEDPNTTKSSLATFGFVFELMQTDFFAIDDFSTLLSHTLGLTQEWLVSNHIIVPAEDEKRKGFRLIHHSVSEILVAEAILATKNPLQSLIRFAVIDQEGIIAIKPSWYGVIGFLLESDSATQVLDWMLLFGKEHTDIVDETYGDVLLSIDASALTDAKRGDIFDLVYGLCRERKLWLPRWSRNTISKFVLTRHISQLRRDLQALDDPVATMVRRGNAVMVVGSLLELKSPLLEKEKPFWKRKLIEYAKDQSGNGVLQRESLDALTHFHDPRIIRDVALALDHEEELVKEAFIRFCYETDPNHPDTLHYLIEGIKRGISIYGRYGLFFITDPTPLKALIQQFGSDDQFLINFLEHESIFSSEKDRGDQQLLDHIATACEKDSGIADEIVVFLATSYRKHTDIHFRESSEFLARLAEIAARYISNFPSLLLQTFRDGASDSQSLHHHLTGTEALFARTLTLKNLEAWQAAVEALPFSSDEKMGEVASVLRTLSRIRGENDPVLQKVLGSGIVLKEDVLRPLRKWQDRPDQKKYQQFKDRLEPESDKYRTDVFNFYVSNVKDITLTSTERDRLIMLAKKLLTDIDPRKFFVRVMNKVSGAGQFTWSSHASYFGDLLRVGQLLFPDELVANYRQKIIDLTPYAFSDDQTTITELIQTVSDDELRWIHDVYLNEQDDRRRLIPSAYIYLVEKFAQRGASLPGAIPVLRSLIEGEDIADTDKESALKTYLVFSRPDDVETKSFLMRLDAGKASENEKERRLGEIANGILIHVYRDDAGIRWRFAELKARVTPFDSKSKLRVHMVGQVEDELHRMAFARPLIDLADPKFIDEFFDLLGFSIDLANRNRSENLWEYTTYLWRIVVAYIENLKTLNTFHPLIYLEEYVRRHVDKGNANWLVASVEEVRKSYINTFGKVTTVSTAINQMVLLLVYQPKTEHTPSSQRVKKEDDITQSSIEQQSSQERWIIFLSHASDSQDGRVLNGERKFVLDLSIRLNKEYPGGVYFDKEKHSGELFGKINRAMKNTDFVVVVFSPRYLHRREIPGTGPNGEFWGFRKYENIEGRYIIIPIAYGMTRSEFDVENLFLGSRHVIAVNENDSISASLKIEKVIQEIKLCIEDYNRRRSHKK